MFVAKFRPGTDNEFVSCGVKHVRFWKVTGTLNTLDSILDRFSHTSHRDITLHAPCAVPYLVPMLIGC